MVFDPIDYTAWKVCVSGGSSQHQLEFSPGRTCYSRQARKQCRMESVPSLAVWSIGDLRQMAIVYKSQPCDIYGFAGVSEHHPSHLISLDKMALGEAEKFRLGIHHRQTKFPGRSVEEESEGFQEGMGGKRFS